MQRLSWTPLVGFEETHLKSHAVIYCGTVMCRQVVEGTHAHAREGVSHKELQARLAREDKEHGRYVNCTATCLEDPNYALMKLDAEFSEDQSAIVRLSKADLASIAPFRWGARRIDEKLYAFTQSPVAAHGSTWLHNYLLRADNQQLHAFADGNTLNCARTNMLPVKICRPTPASEILTISTRAGNKRNSPGLPAGISFQRTQRAYPRGRFEVKFQRGGINKSKSFSIPLHVPDSPALHQEKRAEAEAFLAKLHQEHKQQKEIETCIAQAWTDPTAPGVHAPAHSEPPFTTVNTAYSTHKDKDGRFLGRLLHGQITEFCSMHFCLRFAEHERHSHFDMQHTATAALLQFNVAHGSVNPWTPLADGRTIFAKSSPNRQSPLCPFVVDDDDLLIVELGRHVWLAEADILKPGNLVPRNADPTSPWATPHQLVAYTALRSREIVKSVDDFKGQFSVLLQDDNECNVKQNNVLLVVWKKRDLKNKQELLQDPTKQGFSYEKITLAEFLQSVVAGPSQAEPAQRVLKKRKIEAIKTVREQRPKLEPA